MNLSTGTGEALPTLNEAGKIIDGQTQLVGVMGWPIAHSLSPAMHNAAFNALGMNWCYVPLPVHPTQVAAAIAGLRALGFRGCNVTVPHKEAVLPYIDRLPPHVARFGAANTLILHRDERQAHTFHAALLHPYPAFFVVQAEP